MTEPQVAIEAVTVTEPAPQKEAGFLLSKDEWLDLRREIRSIKTKEPAPPVDTGKHTTNGHTPDVAALMAKVNALESERSFERHVTRSGYQFSADQMGLLESAFQHQRPEADRLADWITRTAGAMGVKPAGTPIPPPVPDPPRNKGTDNNTGTPARTPEGGSKDPRVFATENPEAWARMPDDERRNWMSDWARQNGAGAGAIMPTHLRQRQNK